LNSFPRAHVFDRRLVMWSGIAATIVTGALAVYRPAPLAHLDSNVYDAIVRRAGANPPGTRISIVDIDERSLSAIGQWPWRREVVGRLIGRLRELGAATIALDVLFSEPDRFEAAVQPIGVAGRNARPVTDGPTPSDVSFADALRSERVVLGYALTFDEPPNAHAPCLLHPLNAAIVRPRDADDLSPFFRASGAICTLPVLERAARASGFLNATADADGILRRVPLIMELDGRLYPGLALAAVMADASTRAVTVRVENANAAQLSGDLGMVPLDGKGNMLLRYRGGKRSFRYVSAADVLAERAPADAFRGALVFVGATALGAREVVATPFDTHFPGVEVQATVADNLLRQDFIRRSQYAVMVETAFVILGALPVVLLVARSGLGVGSVGAALCLVLLWRGSVWRLSTGGEFLSPLFPALGVIAALAATTVAGLLVERRRAERAGRKMEMSQRLLVQSLLSLTEARDPATGQHACRTQRYTRLLAEQLASHPKFRDYLTPERIDLLASLAPLHDIGKVAIPDRLLNKPGVLTREELLEMRKHPAYGRDVILQAERRAGACDDPILALAKEIVYTHHERWDGTGYPQGLVDEQIPISGRLVALVDVFDALTTRRVYRPPLPQHAAIDLIVEERGKHFDPAVVDAFLKLVPVLAAAPSEALLAGAP
jgi:HD-GYP domain-containing protein (c-di-GMP phosphodiesterase class II)